MTPAQRVRVESIAHGRFLAPLPTAEDVRILLAENARLREALDAAVKTAADVICRRLLEQVR